MDTLNQWFPVINHGITEPYAIREWHEFDNGWSMSIAAHALCAARPAINSDDLHDYTHVEIAIADPTDSLRCDMPELGDYQRDHNDDVYGYVPLRDIPMLMQAVRSQKG